MSLLIDSNTFVLKALQFFSNLMNQSSLVRVKVGRKFKLAKWRVILKRLEKLLKVCFLLSVSFLLFICNLFSSLIRVDSFHKSCFALTWCCTLLNFLVWCLIILPIMLFFKFFTFSFAKLLIIFGYLSRINFFWLCWLWLLSFNNSDSVARSYLIVSCIIKWWAYLSMLAEVWAKWS